MNGVCEETRLRIKLSVWAFAYEIANQPLVSDAVYDFNAYQVNLKNRTKRPDLDFWFICNFRPDTGLWIHDHPELDKLERLYTRLYPPNKIS